MKKNQASSPDPSDLRRQAEERLKQNYKQAGSALDARDNQRLIHELEVHQIELEMQNDELHLARQQNDEHLEKFIDLFDFAPVGYFILDSLGNIYSVNLTGASLLGLERAKLIGRRFSLFLAAESRPAFTSFVHSVFAKKEKEQCEVTLLAPKGGPRHLRIEGTAEESTGQQALQCRLAMTDITEIRRSAIALRSLLEDERRIQEELRREHENLSAIMQASPVGLIVLDEEERIVNANPAVERLFGKSLADLQRRRCGELIACVNRHSHPEGCGHAELCPECPLNLAIQEVLSAGRGIHDREMEAAIETGGATARRWLRFSIEPVQFNGRKHVIAALHDITERKLTEQAQSFLLGCGLPGAGEDFFQSLARYLAESLGMDYVCIDRLEGGCLSAQTVAVFNQGQFERNVAYALKDTPCGEVVGKTICCFPQGVCSLFPQDAALQELKAESYIGVTLWDSKGRPIGLIALIGQKPLLNPQWAETLLKLVAARAAGELERRKAEEALRENERAVSTLMGNLPGMAYRCKNDQDLTMQFISAGSLALTGYAPGELMNNANISYTKLIHPSDHKRIWSEVQAAITQSRPYTVEYRILSATGLEKWVWERGCAIRNPAGGIEALEGFILDITEHKRAEEALAEEAIRRRILIEESSDGIVVLDQDGKVYEANKRFGEMLGYSAEEVRQLGVWDWDTQWTREQLLEMIQLVDVAGDHFETRHRRKNGKYFDVEISSNGAVCSGKKLVFCVCRDITERKQAAAALRESEEKYRVLIHNANEAIYVVQQGSIKFANAMFAQITGWNELEVIDQSMYAFLPEDMHDKVSEHHRRLLLGEIAGDKNEFRALTQSGEERWMSVNSVRIIWEEEPATLNFATDITERKRAEEAEKQEQALNKAIIESIPGTFYMLDETGRYVRWSAYQRDNIVGKSDSEIAQTYAIDTIHPDDRALVFSKIENVLKNGVEEIVEGRVLLSGGPEFQWLLMTGRQMVIKGRPFLIGIGIDISERKRVEHALRKSEEKYRNIFDNASEGIFQSSPEGRYLSVNPAFARMFGYASPDEVVSTITDIAHQLFADARDRERLLKMLAEQDSVKDFETLMKRRDGRCCGFPRACAPSATAPARYSTLKA